jgi:excisionase family DNA binding protein
MSGLLKTSEVADELKMSPRFVVDEIRRNNLRASKMGGEWRVSRADLETYVAAHANVRPVGRTA